jgi:hypothetical protein
VVKRGWSIGGKKSLIFLRGEKAPSDMVNKINTKFAVQNQKNMPIASKLRGEKNKY